MMFIIVRECACVAMDVICTANSSDFSMNFEQVYGILENQNLSWISGQFKSVGSLLLSTEHLHTKWWFLDRVGGLGNVVEQNQRISAVN